MGEDGKGVRSTEARVSRMNSVGASGCNPVGLVFREWRLATILPALLLVCSTCAFALDPSLDISQYAHTAWRMRDGFPKGAITSIAQTPDGYLWLGTELGLFRFDGVRAVPWQPPPGEQLPSPLITSLLVARDGTLWIGTMKGLASWKEGRFTHYPEVAGQIVVSLLQDHEETVWFSTWEPGRLCAIQSGKVRCYGAGTFGQAAYDLYEDALGSLWVSTSSGVWSWRAGSLEHYPLPGDLFADAVIEDGNGSILIATVKGLERLAGGKIESYGLPGVTAQFRPNRFFRSSDGSLWIGAHEGLLRLRQGKTDFFGAADGLSGDSVSRIFEDRERNIWVATASGLDKFREYPIPTISRNQGLSNSVAWSVQAAQDGSVWLGTADVLNRLTDDRMTLYRTQQVLGQGRRKDDRYLNAGKTATEVVNSGLVGSPQSLGLDDQRRLCVSTSSGVFCFEDGRFVRVPGIPPGGNIWSIVEDGHGKTWISDANSGLLSFGSETAVQSTPWSRFGQKSYWARALLPDPSSGGVWLGFWEGGIAHFKDGQVGVSYTAADGLGSGRVNHLRFGSRGAIWAATESGLSRIKDGHIETLSSKNGLPCDEVHWSIEDDDHAVWVYMPCGLARIDRSEWYAWADDPRHVVKSTLFDASDGVGTVGVYGSYSPHVTKSPDGRIWFVSWGGVSIIDPHHLPINKLPPPVHIEQITADGKNYDPAHASLPRRVRDLTIDYTALSLVAPEKVRFRVMLEGQDTDWRELVNVRQVRYTNLPPRHYRFRVIAANNSGVWNEVGDSLDFDIPPAWYQAMWFRAICIAAFMTLLWAVYQLRVHQLREQEKKFRETIESIPAMAFVSLPDGYRTFVNKGWVEYTGMTVEQSLGSGWHTVIHPDDLNRVLGEWEAALASGQPMCYEARYRRTEGRQYRWFMVRVVPQRNKRGKIVKWFGTLTDIEDRKRAEEALRSSEAYLVEAQNLTRTGSCAIDGMSRETVYWSDEMFRLFGFDPQQGLPMFDQWLQRIHPEDREKVRLASERTFVDKVGCEIEFRFVNPDGAVKHIQGIGHPVLSPTGDLVQVLGTMVDVTERKRAEEAREKLRQLEAVLAHTNRVSTMGELVASMSHELAQPITVTINHAKASLRWLSATRPN